MRHNKTIERDSEDAAAHGRRYTSGEVSVR
jgi:hypothetical protein